MPHILNSVGMLILFGISIVQPFGIFSGFSSFDPRPISMTAFHGKMAPKLMPTSMSTIEEPIVDEEQPVSPKPTAICTILLRTGLYERNEVTEEEKWAFCGRHCARRPECFFTALPCHCPCSCKAIASDED